MSEARKKPESRKTNFGSPAKSRRKGGKQYEKRVLTMLLALVKQCRTLEKKIYKVTELRKLAEDAAEEPKPTEPAKPVDPTNPATGDGMNVALNVALCLAAAIGMAGMAITRKKF